MDKNNIDRNKLEQLLGTVSGKIGISPEQLKKELDEGRFDSALSAMNKSDADKFQKIVNNPKLLEKMMSTPQAMALYKKLSGK